MRPVMTQAEAVAVAVAHEHGLLMLDTCEHVVVGAAELAVGCCAVRPGSVCWLRAGAGRAYRGDPRGLCRRWQWPRPTASAEDREELSVQPLFCARAEPCGPTSPSPRKRGTSPASVALDGLPLASSWRRPGPMCSHRRPFALVRGPVRLLVDGSRKRHPDSKPCARRSTGASTCSLRTSSAISQGSACSKAASTWRPRPPWQPRGPPTRCSSRRPGPPVHGRRARGDRYRLLERCGCTARNGSTVRTRSDASKTRRARCRLGEAAELHVRADEQLEWLGGARRAEIADLRAAADWSFEGGDGLAGARAAPSPGSGRWTAGSARRSRTSSGPWQSPRSAARSARAKALWAMACWRHHWATSNERETPEPRARRLAARPATTPPPATA